MGEHFVRPSAGADGRGLSRRGFVLGAAGAVGAAAVVGRVGSAGASSAPPRIVDHPFTLGVASGDPLPNGVVLWTRLAPLPTEGGGMAPETYRVEWEVAEDPAMRRVIRRGTARARPDHAHSVHEDVRGLRSGRDYWYRFRVDGHLSPIGRTRTAPHRNGRPSELVFGHVSCQRYNAGYYTAYDDLVSAGPDLVVHVGDYIYESPGGGVRTDPLPESVSLDEYRNRYGLYKQDPSLMAAHHAAPWLFTWDDHEVENNHAGVVPEEGSTTPDPAEFLARRAAAYKAYWEHMPFRRPAPTGPDFPIHRQVRWGRLADLFVLDTRQYRDDQCGEIGVCDPALDADREMLGSEQQEWLDDGLRRSKADWAVLAQQVVFSRMNFVPSPAEIYNLDQWDGYQTARRRVLASLVEHHPRGNVVLTGDIHASGASDVLADFGDPTSQVLGAEFIATSISSQGSAGLQAVVPSALAANPHLKSIDTRRRGWIKHTVTSGSWRADYRAVDPEGHRWIFATRVRDVAPEDMVPPGA